MFRNLKRTLFCKEPFRMEYFHQKGKAIIIHELFSTGCAIQSQIGCNSFRFFKMEAVYQSAILEVVSYLHRDKKKRKKKLVIVFSKGDVMSLGFVRRRQPSSKMDDSLPQFARDLLSEPLRLAPPQTPPGSSTLPTPLSPPLFHFILLKKSRHCFITMIKYQSNRAPIYLFL